MAHDTGKTVREGDPEVSEAIDMAALRRAAGARCSTASTRRHDAARPVVVAPPWNFPLRDPRRRCARRARRGQHRDPQAGARVGAHGLRSLAELPVGRRRAARRAAVRAVPRRRGRPSARHPCRRRHRRAHRRVRHRAAVPRLAPRPAAASPRPSGKNALVVTAAADLDLAVVDLVRSAFGHAGQKCSAASLAIVEASVLRRRTLSGEARRRRPLAPRRPGHRSLATTSDR